MIAKESEWYRDVINARVRSGSLVLNVGSSTKYVAEVSQPYIKKNVIDILAKKQCVVKNIDIKKSEGVDIVGDISDPAFAAEIRALKPDVIICANTLEHIGNRQAFSKGLESLLGDQTILILSAPHTFPYHEDPIDTMYRTDVAGLETEFPSLQMLEGKVLTMSYFSVIARKYSPAEKILFFIKSIVKFVVLILILRWKEATDVIWTFRRVRETCAVFVRQPAI